MARTINANIASITACYEAELKGQPNLRGGVTVRFDIDATGGVLKATLTRNELPERAGRCLLSVFASLHFPPAQEGVATFEYPFSFTPAQ